MYNYLKYSGACVIINLNPLHWSLLPKIMNESNIEWGSPEETYSFVFLFLKIRFWIDNGEW